MKAIDDILHETFGLRQFRLMQREVITDILSGKDVLCVMPTGAGKSLCYQLPAGGDGWAGDCGVAVDFADAGSGATVT